MLALANLAFRPDEHFFCEEGIKARFVEKVVYLQPLITGMFWF